MSSINIDPEVPDSRYRKHCCSVLTGVSDALLQRLQSVLNAAALSDIQSLPAFRQKLKLTLFSDSFAS